MRLRLPRPLVVKNLAVVILAGACATPGGSFAAPASPTFPAWLKAHIGDGEGQVAATVLQRARDLYQQKLREGVVKNPCYFAMDATRPNNRSDGKPARRFYVVCESEKAFRAISAGHGGGRDLPGVGNFENGRRCAKNFGNAQDSFLTAGGAYVTAETKSSFKGTYRAAGGGEAVLTRSFVQFDGEDETANARERAIGGHAAVVLKNVCLRKDPSSPHANQDGYVPFGTRVEYAGGRSDGCTAWAASDVPQLLALVKDDPTTLYIYPEAADVHDVAEAVAAGSSPGRAGSYWNASCLREIGAPKYWPKQTLEPLLAAYRRDHPAPPPRPTPICRGP